MNADGPGEGAGGCPVAVGIARVGTGRLVRVDEGVVPLPAARLHRPRFRIPPIITRFIRVSGMPNSMREGAGGLT